MHDLKQVILVILAIGAVLISGLASSALLAPHSNPIVLVAVMGAVIAAVLAIVLGRSIAMRFRVQPKSGTSGEFESSQGE